MGIIVIVIAVLFAWHDARIRDIPERLEAAAERLERAADRIDKSSQDSVSTGDVNLSIGGDPEHDARVRDVLRSQGYNVQ